MKRLKATTLILVGVAFCLALLGGLRWSAQPMFRPPQGLHNGSEADLVRVRYPHRLVDPSELNVADDKVSCAWVGAEIKARIKTVSISLGICVGVAIILCWRRRDLG